MYEEFVKEFNLKDKTREELNTILVQSIIKTNKDLQSARNNYQIKANQSKLNYLIKKSKANGITIDRLKQMELRNIQIDNVI